MNRRTLTVSLIAIIAAAGCSRQQAPSPASNIPVIDMHLHTLWWEPGMKEPLTGFVAPNTPDELRMRTLAELDRHHIIKAVASGEQLSGYRESLGDRIIPGLLVLGKPSVSPDAIRQMYRQGELAVLAEFAPQYAGLPPNAPALEPYWAVAEELDLPVGIHMGLGPPGAAYAGYPEYRMQLSNPLQMEDVLIRHPKLRVYVMHAGWPMLNEMIGLLYAHPQVYVDVAVIDWVLPQVEFDAYLRRLVDAGFSKRIMFGSDNMMWSESFGVALDRIKSASFLSTDQKRDILCRNAATFLRLQAEICQS